MVSRQLITTIKITFLWLIALRVIAALGYFLIYERFAPLDFLAPWLQTNFLFWSWANFDGEHYLSIAKFGYQIRNGFPQYAFFPLLPLLISIVSIIFRDYLISGLIVVGIALYYVIATIPKWFKELNLQGSNYFLLALLLSPGAVFLGSVYTEALFIALTLGVFYFSEKRRWLPAALLAGLASATRINGLFVVLFFLIKFWAAKPNLKSFLSLGFVSLSGFLSYLTYLYYSTGDFLAFYHSQAYWGKATATSPLATAASYLRAVSIEFKPDLTHLVVVFEVAITLWSAYLIYLVIKKKLLSFPYIVYLLGNLALPVITGSLGSMPRFFLILFPAHVAVVGMKPSIRTTIYTIYVLMMITGVILFTRGHWYA